MKKIIALYFLLLPGMITYGQSGWYSVEAGYGYGSVIRHRATISHLITAHPQLLYAGIYQNAKNGGASALYNYPDTGWLVLHQRFFDPRLGSMTAVNYTQNYYLLDRNNTRQLHINTGIGLGYNPVYLDFDSNNQNIAVSSPFSISVHFRLLYTFPFWENQYMRLGLFYTHFSNSSLRQPNLGINSIFLQAGWDWDYKHWTVRYKIPEKEIFVPGKYELYGGLGLSFHEVKAKTGVFPVYIFSVLSDKRITRKTGIQAGMEYIYSLAYRNLAGFLSRMEGIPPRDFKQFGLFAGHALYFEHWYIDSRVGYYLYNPLGRTSNLFQYVGIDYQFRPAGWRLGFGIKVHNFKADYTAISVYRKIL